MINGLIIGGSVLAAAAILAAAWAWLRREDRLARIREDAETEAWVTTLTAELHHEDHGAPPGWWHQDAPGNLVTHGDTALWQGHPDLVPGPVSADVPGREPPDRPEAGDSAPAVQQAAAEMARPAGDPASGAGMVAGENPAQGLSSPDETPAPEPSPLAKARAAMDELAVMPPSTYLAQLAAGTAYAERPPLRSWLSDDTIARGMPAIKEA